MTAMIPRNTRAHNQDHLNATHDLYNLAHILYASHVGGLDHWIRDCKLSSDQEKQNMREDIAEMRSSAGPSRSTRSQTAADNQSQTVSGTGGSTLRTVKMPDTNSTKMPDNTVQLSDGIASLQTTGRCYDGSDDSIASADIAEKASALGIGRIQQIGKMQVSVAIGQRDEEPPGSHVSGRGLYLALR